jgi:predicted transcriptional regulator
MVSDRGLLAWFFSYCEKSESFLRFTSNSLQHLALPSLNLDTSVTTSRSSDSVLDAMKVMSEQGVSSVAVIDDDTGGLLSAVSVTDIGKVCVFVMQIQIFDSFLNQIVVPSQSKQVLSTPLQHFVSLIKVRLNSCI